MTLEEEASRLNQLLVGKTVKLVWRHRPRELGVEFTDGTRLFVDERDGELDLSMTGTEPED